jgi:hypothetical protein
MLHQIANRVPPYPPESTFGWFFEIQQVLIFYTLYELCDVYINIYLDSGGRVSANGWFRCLYVPSFHRCLLQVRGIPSFFFISE